jgi:hypothetical protein
VLVGSVLVPRHGRKERGRNREKERRKRGKGKKGEVKRNGGLFCCSFFCSMVRGSGIRRRGEEGVHHKERRAPKGGEGRGGEGRGGRWWWWW